MRNRRLRKGLTAASLSAAMMLAGSSFAFGAAQALPDRTNQKMRRSQEISVCSQTSSWVT